MSAGIDTPRIAIARLRAPWWRRALAWLRWRRIEVRTAVVGDDGATRYARAESWQQICGTWQRLISDNEDLKRELNRKRAEMLARLAGRAEALAQWKPES